MFNKFVVRIDKSEVSLFKLQGGKATKITFLAYTKDDLQSILTQLLTKISLKKVSFLFAEGVSYHLTLDIDRGLSPEEERSQVMQVVGDTIPDKLDGEYWDLLPLKEGSKEQKRVLFFAPVADIYNSVKDYAQLQGLTPKVYSEKYFSLLGKDPVVASRESGFHPGKMVIFLLLVLLLGGVGFYFRVSLQSKLTLMQNMVSSRINTKPAAENQIQETPAVEPTPAPFETSNYTIAVQNGSGIAGSATKVADLLEAEGFKIAETSNADRFDYTQTEVFVKDKADSRLFEEINRALNSDYQLQLATDPLTDNLDYDALVIVGEAR